MNNKITVTGANKFFFVFSALFLIFQLLLGFLSTIYGGEVLDRNTYRIILVNEYVIILIPILIYSFAKKFNLKEAFRLNKLGLLPALLIALISLPAYFAASMINTVMIYLLQFIGSVPSQPIPVPGNIKELLIGILIIAVSPGICEELLNRGILLKAYEKRGSMKAVVITAIFFGIFHFDITNFFGPVFLGLIIGYYVIRTNSILAGMLAHFLSNTIAELFQYFGGKEQALSPTVTVSLGDLGDAVIYGIAGLILVGILLRLFKSVTEGKSSLIPSIGSIKSDIISIATHWPIMVVVLEYLVVAGLTLLTIAVGQ